MTPASPSGPAAQRREWRRLLAAVATAALLWFYMFSPWTAGRPNFWLVMAVSATILTTLALCFLRPYNPGRKNAGKCAREGDSFADARNDRTGAPGTAGQIALGVVIAFALWGIFWIGDKVSSWMFGFARPEVNAVYAMKEGLPPWLIGLLLLLLIGPAEEFFWRGYVQRTLGRLLAARQQDESRARTVAFLLTLAVYTLIHIWSGNFMLVMAALVAGAVWGLLYRLRPQLLPALIISHALWDALVFVILPI